MGKKKNVAPRSEKFEKILSSKKSTSVKLKDMSKIEGGYIKTDQGIDSFTITQALKKHTRIEELKSDLNEAQRLYDELRDELIKQINQIENSEYDTVEYINDGVRLKKYPKNSKAGKIDLDKLKVLARQKKVLGKVIKKEEVVNEEAVLKMVEDGVFTEEEYLSITRQVISPVVEIKYFEQKSGTSTNDNNQGTENNEDPEVV